MAHWENYFGGSFETEEDAREDAELSQEWDDIEEFFQMNVDYHKLFEFAREHYEDFFNRFEDELLESTEEFFRDNYYEVTGEEEEEE